MKILMLCYEFPPVGGGGAAVVHGLSTELARGGHEVDVVTMAFRGEARREEFDGVRVERVPSIRLHRHLCTVIEAGSYLGNGPRVIRRLLAASKYDLVHAHFIFPDGLLAMRASKSAALPLLITAHGTDVPGYNPHRVRLLHRLLRPLWRRVVESASLIVCGSQTLANLVQTQGVGTPVVVVPNGMNVWRYRVDRSRRSRILVVTRMLERKGIQYLIRALARGPTDYELHIVGDGPYLPTLRRLAEPLGPRVRFRGWLDRQSAELRELYETSQIFALPSEAENFPVVLLEAMSAGLAIITTKGTGCSEVVGDTALLVNPRDVDSIREGVKTLTENKGLATHLGKLARERVESEFSWPAVTQRYLEQYKRVLASRELKSDPRSYGAGD